MTPTKKTQGFVILRSYPIGLPEVVPHVPLATSATALKHFGHESMVTLQRVPDWMEVSIGLCDYVSTGVMPTRGPVDDQLVTEKTTWLGNF